MTKKSKKRLIISVVCFIIVALGGGGAYLYYLKSAETDKAETAYEALKDSYDTTLFEDYLKQFPRSQHAAWVEKRLTQLKGMERAWNMIAEGGSMADYVNFMNQFNDSRYETLCRHKIDSIDWSAARLANSEEALRRYLASHPDGAYTSEATVMLEEIEATATDELLKEDVGQMLQSFFTALGENNDVEYCRYLAPTMTNFLGKRNVQKAEVTQIVDRMFNEHIKNCTFTMSNDLKLTRTLAPEGTTLHALFTVDQRIDRDDDGKKFATYRVAADITDDQMISAISMKET